ncbi:VIT domain-containing protein, partial [Myxococcota bacterium]
MARTEVDEVFTNTTDQALEGVYRFPLPPESQLERLAWETDGKLQEGMLVERQRATTWREEAVNVASSAEPLTRDEIVWRPGGWRDPTRVAWESGGGIEIRVPPIPGGGTRRVKLSYTQTLAPTGVLRRYTYPLAYGSEGSSQSTDFRLEAHLRGHDRTFGVRTTGYELARTTDGSDVQILSLAQSRFVPAGDLTFEYALPPADSELRAWVHPPDGHQAQPGTGPAPGLTQGKPRSYVALALQPRLPRVPANQRQALALVVDASRSTFGESYRRATEVATRIVSELEPKARFTVLVCDTTCRQWPDGMTEPTREAAQEVGAFLSHVVPDGASDLVTAVRSGYRALEGDKKREPRVVYIGDGASTVGPIRPAYLDRSVRRAAPSARGRLIALAVGGNSDLDALRAVARSGGGVVLRYMPGQTATEAALAVLSASYGQALRDVRVALPKGLTEVFPRQVDTFLAGSESYLVARMTQPEVKGNVTVEGALGDKPFRRTYSLDIKASQTGNTDWVPRWYAVAQITDLEQESEREARQRALELARQFHVPSRHTSMEIGDSPVRFLSVGFGSPSLGPEQDRLDALGLSQANPQGLRPLRCQPGVPCGERVDEFSAWVAGLPPAVPIIVETAAARPPSVVEVNSPSELTEPSGPLFRYEAFPATHRPWIPLRSVWKRVGEITTDRTLPEAVSAQAIAEAEQ